MVLRVAVEDLIEALKAAGVDFRLKAIVEGRSSLAHKPLLLITSRFGGEEVRHAIFYAELLDFSILMETLVFYKDTGIQPIIVYSRSTKEVLDRTRELGILTVQLKNKDSMVEQFKRIFKK